MASAAKAQIRAQIQQACDENIIGFESAYLLTFWVAAVAVLLGLLLPGWPAPWAGRAGMQQQAGAGH